MPLISVILPTCDRPELLGRAVASVLAQSDADFELIVVDNNRGLPPLDPANSPFLANPRLRLVRAPDARNASQARNAGLAAAAGKWISYLDDDDEYAPGKLSRCLERAQAENAGLVLCGAELVLNHRKRRVQCHTDHYAGDDLLHAARWSTPLLFHRHHPALLFEPSLSAGEDAFFAQSALALWNLSRVPVLTSPLVVMHQDGPERPRTNLRGDDNWRAARRLWWQFGGRYSKAARRLFVLRALIAREKARRHPGACLRFCLRLLRAGGPAQGRFALNALVLSCGFGHGRLVS